MSDLLEPDFRNEISTGALEVLAAIVTGSAEKPWKLVEEDLLAALKLTPAELVPRLDELNGKLILQLTNWAGPDESAGAPFKCWFSVQQIALPRLPAYLEELECRRAGWRGLPPVIVNVRKRPSALAG